MQNAEWIQYSVWVSLLRDSMKHLVPKLLQSISRLCILHSAFCILHFALKKWWAKMDSNHRPHDYQSCALASWAIGPCRWNQIHNLRIWCLHQMLDCVFVSPPPFKPASLGFKWDPLLLLVEISGIEPLTSCLQGRRSPSWAKPPDLSSPFLGTSLDIPSKLNNTSIYYLYPCTDLRTLQEESSFFLKSP